MEENQRNMTSGRLIVFEGIDGSGKSTQFKLMCDRLKGEDRDFRRVVFPRYDEPSSALIKMYLAGDFGGDPGAVNAYAASSFYAVDRFASYVQDWRGYYESGGLVLTDRYTTSNALHQGAKMVSEEREGFFKWLYEYEFDLIGLPSPDLVIYMDIDAELAGTRLKRRQTETGTSGDIHEKDAVYLSNCAQSGRQAAAQYGWHVISCVRNGCERSEAEIHREIYERIFNA
jgi:dTMP kinase